MIGVAKIATEKEVLEFFKSAYAPRKRSYYGFYNSMLGKVILNQHLMLLPVDERIATRAHGVFDVAYVKQSRIINLDSHLNRLYNSAASVSIVPPFSKEQTRQVVIDTVSTVIGHHKLSESVFGIRMTISSGYGDLGISSLQKQSILYLLMFEPYIDYEKEKLGVNEFVVATVKQAKLLVHAKTIDYVQNAIMANESKMLGGYQGIKAMTNGVLLEAAMANIAFLFGKEFATPRLETVVQGTTLKKLLAYISQLQNEGYIDRISFRDITLFEAYTATEMMLLGGDKIVPVLNLDGKPISAHRGLITEKCQLWYQATNEEGTYCKAADSESFTENTNQVE